MAERDSSKRILYLKSMTGGGEPSDSNKAARSGAADGEQGSGKSPGAGPGASDSGAPSRAVAARKAGALPLPRFPVPKRSRPDFDRGGNIELTAKIADFPGRKKLSYGFLAWLAASVLVPVAAASVYFGIYASNQFVSEFRFAVTTSDSQSSQSASGGLAALFSGAASAASQQNYLVTDYITSPEVVKELQARIDISKLYSRAHVDWLSRFDPAEPNEKLIRFWKSMVTANYDPISGLVNVEVRAFTPEDAHLIAAEVVKLAEALVNGIATRPQKDAVRFAEAEVRRAEDHLKQVRANLTSFRNTEKVIDPNNSVVTSNITLAQTLRASISQLQTEIATLLKQQVGQNSPTVQVLQSKIAATRSQLLQVESEINKSGDSSQALSKVVGQYEQLDLERQFAQNMVTSTMQTLEQARAVAAAQHLYITPYVPPTFPNSSTYPSRLKSVLVVGAYAVMAWLLGLLLYRSVREHV